MDRDTKKKVVYFHLPFQGSLGDYEIFSFDPMKYFSKGDHLDVSDLLTSGLNGFLKRRGISSHAHIVDKLYRARDPAYFRLLREFMEIHGDADIIFMAQYNFLHPEFIFHELKRPIKILGFIDDPISTYKVGIPYLWAFDGAFYISPSYDENTLFADALDRWGCHSHYWWPLVTRKFMRPAVADGAFFSDRDVELIYIGNQSPWKMPRLIKLLNRYRDRLTVHGYWGFGGGSGFLRPLLGKRAFFRRVTSITEIQKANLMWKTKVGVNMHVSPVPRETGNMRMYELCVHGVCQVCDMAGADAHKSIFEPMNEVVFYEDMDDAFEKIDWLLSDDQSRIRIAHAGFERYWRDYDWEDNVLQLLAWADGLRTTTNLA